MTFELRYIKALADVKCLGNKTDGDDEEMRILCKRPNMSLRTFSKGS